MPKKGGKRPGAGRPKGSKNKPDPRLLAREAMRQASIHDEAAALQAFRQHVMGVSGRLFVAQMRLAEGCTLLLQHRTGCPPRIVKDQATILRYVAGELKDEDGWMEITTDRPNNFAISDMLDRCYGKAQQSVAVSGDLSDAFIVNCEPAVLPPLRKEP